MIILSSGGMALVRVRLIGPTDDVHWRPYARARCFDIGDCFKHRTNSDERYTYYIVLDQDEKHTHAEGHDGSFLLLSNDVIVQPIVQSEFLARDLWQWQIHNLRIGIERMAHAGV